MGRRPEAASGDSIGNKKIHNNYRLWVNDNVNDNVNACASLKDLD